jgi:hypothetical protein
MKPPAKNSLPQATDYWSYSLLAQDGDYLLTAPDHVTLGSPARSVHLDCEPPGC